MLKIAFEISQNFLYNLDNHRIIFYLFVRIDKIFPFAADMIQVTILYGKGITFMKEYEVFVETINPCGGSRHAQSEFIDVEAESPEAYVKEHGRFPIMDTFENQQGDVVIVTGDSNGYIIRYTFSE